MPTGLKGQKRSADVIGNAVKVMRIAASEETKELDSVNSAAAELGARGDKVRAARLSAVEKREIATVAADERWAKRKKYSGETEPSLGGSLDPAYAAMRAGSSLIPCTKAENTRLGSPTTSIFGRRSRISSHRVLSCNSARLLPTQR